MFTLKNIFRTRRQPETRYTISIAWPDGSGAFNYPVSLPEYAASMLQAGQVPQHVAIWKHSAPPSGFGTENMAPSQLCHLLCSPLKRSPATDG